MVVKALIGGGLMEGLMGQIKEGEWGKQGCHLRAPAGVGGALVMEAFVEGLVSCAKVATTLDAFTAQLDRVGTVLGGSRTG
jgi:hypothetical protein